MKRDFTYIDDIIEGLMRVMYEIPISTSNKQSTAEAPSRILNIGNNNPVTLHDFIEALETPLGMKAKKITYQCSQAMFHQHMQTLMI